MKTKTKKAGRNPNNGQYSKATDTQCVVVERGTLLAKLAAELKEAAKEGIRKAAKRRRQKQRHKAYLSRQAERAAKRCNAKTTEATLTHNPFATLKGAK